MWITGGQPHIEGVDVTAPGGTGVVVQGNQTKALIRLTRVHHCGQNGFSVQDGCSELTEVTSCENSGIGIEIRREANPKVMRGKFHENQGDGICFLGKTMGSFENCESFRNGDSGIRLHDSSSPMVLGCKFYENQESGIVLYNKTTGSSRTVNPSRTSARAFRYMTTRTRW